MSVRSEHCFSTAGNVTPKRSCLTENVNFLVFLYQNTPTNCRDIYF